MKQHNKRRFPVDSNSVCLLLLCVVFAASNVTAQNSSLQGIVKDEATLSPLEKVSIELHSVVDSAQLTGTFTNSNGVFALNKIRHGNYYLIIRSTSYQPKIITELKLNDNNIDIGIITLKAAVNSLRAVTVSAKQRLIGNSIDRQVFLAGQFLNAKGGTAMDVLKNLPSISINGLGEISVRGSGDMQVLINGKQFQGSTDVILSQLAANNIESIELITVPSAKFDADGKAGIINIITKKETGNGWFVTLNGQLGLPSLHAYDNHVLPKRYGGDATITYNHDKWNIAVALNYLRNDAAGFREGDVNTTTGNDVFTSFPSNGERSFNRYNYAARTSVTYTADKNNVFNVGFYAGKKFQARAADLLYTVTRRDISNDSLIGQFKYFNHNLQTKEADIYLGNIDYTHSFQNKSVLTISFLYEYDDLYGNTKNLNEAWPKINDTIQYTYNPSTNPLHGAKATAGYNYTIGKLKLESGYQYRYNKQEGNFLYLTQIPHINEYVVDSAFSSNVKTITKIHAVYTQLNGQTKRLQYAAGLRYEYSQRIFSLSNNMLPGNTLTLNNLFPSASIVYALQNQWKLKADYSRRIQRINNFELNPFPEREHSETLERGDPNLLPELTGILQTGIVKDYKSGSLFSTLYYQHSKNPIQRVNSVYNDTILNRIYTNAGNADKWGLEAGFSATPAKWLQLYAGGNLYNYKMSGWLFDDSVRVHNTGWVYSFNTNIGLVVGPTLSVQFSVNYISEQPTAQGENSSFLSPNTAIKKTFMQGRLAVALQWQNMDMGLNISNRQRITTWGEYFYTTTNYIVEPDVFLLNFSFNLKQNNRRIKLPNSEFGDKEF